MTESAATAKLPLLQRRCRVCDESRWSSPHALQAASWHLFEAHSLGKIGEACRESVQKGVGDTLAGPFRHWWTRFSPGQRVRMAELATGIQPESQNEAIMKTLSNYGFVEQAVGGFRILGTAFAEWIRSEARSSKNRDCALTRSRISARHPGKDIEYYFVSEGKPIDAGGGERQETDPQIQIC